MGSYRAFAGSITRDIGSTKYILTRPTKLSDLTIDDLEDETEHSWRQKSRQLQVRRWRKIKHQLV